MRWRHYVLAVAPPAGLLVLVLCVYGRALAHGLVSDDFLLFAQVRDGLGSALAYHGSYHWYPLGQTVLWIQLRLAGSSGELHHGVTVLLFWGLGLATVRLGRRLGLARPTAWAGGTLLVTSILPFEVPLWAIGSLYSVSSLLVIAAFLAYLRLVADPGVRRQVVFVAIFAAAVLVHEQAAGLPVAAALWSLLVARERDLRRLTLRLAPALAALAAYIALKFALTDGTHLLPGIERGIRGVVGPAVFHGFRLLLPFLPSEAAWAVLRPTNSAGWALSAGLFLAMAAIASRLDARERFLGLWGLSQVAMMAFAVGLASRHYALPLVPATLLLASLAHRVARGSKAVLLATIATLALLGALQLRPKVDAWGAASRAAERILDDVSRAARTRPEARALVTIDLPDGLPQGESEPAYIFRLGFEDAVRERLPGHFVRLERLHTEPRQSWVEPFSRPLAPEERAALAADPGVLVMICPSPEEGLRIDALSTP